MTTWKLRGRHRLPTLTGTIQASGDVRSDVFDLHPVALAPLLGAFTIIGDIQVPAVQFDLEPSPIAIQGTITPAGQIRTTVNLVTSAPVAVNGTVTSSGNVGFGINIGANPVAINGTYTVGGNIGIGIRKDLVRSSGPTINGTVTAAAPTLAIVVPSLTWVSTNGPFPASITQGSSLDLTPYISDPLGELIGIGASGLPSGVSVSSSAPWKLNATAGAVTGDAQVTLTLQKSTYSTSFPNTESRLDEGGSWVNGGSVASGGVGVLWNNMQSTPGKAFGTTHTPSGYPDNIAHLTGTFNDNQSIEAVVYRAPGYNPSTNHEIELLLRFAITANNARGYELLCNTGGASEFVRWNGASGDFYEIPIQSGPGLGVLADGDVVKAEIIGTTLRAYKNGVLCITSVDSTWSSGKPGIGAFSRGGDVVLSSYGWKSILARSL